MLKALSGRGGVQNVPSMNDFSLHVGSWRDEAEASAAQHQPFNHANSAEDKKAPPQLQVAPLLMSALSGLSSQSSLPSPDTLSTSLSSSPTQQTKPQWKRSGLDMYEYANLARSSGPL